MAIARVRERNQRIDVVRGVAIVLVVLGHAIQSVYPDYENVFLFRLIYSFHMPLFMYLSGRVSYKSNGANGKEWLKRRFLSLLIPFIVWIPLPYIFNWNNEVVWERVKHVIKDPTCGSWFLLVLFMICMSLTAIQSISIYFKIKVEYAILAFIVISTITVNIIPVWIGIALTVKYSVFFYSGYLREKWADQIISKRMQGKCQILLGIIWIFLTPFWKRVGYHLDIFSTMVSKGISRPLIKALNLGFDWLVAFGGIAFVFSMCLAFSKKKIFFFVGKLGQYTIEIYLLHKYFFYFISVDNYILQVIIRTLFGLGISYLVAILFGNCKVSKLLWGKSCRFTDEAYLEKKEER